MTTPQNAPGFEPALPAAQAPHQVEPPKRRTGLFVFGVVLIVLGSLMLLGTAANPGWQEGLAAETSPDGRMGFMIGVGVMVVLAIVAIVVGARMTRKAKRG